MRCMNCGWDNHSNTTVCLKCGQPLRMPENYANSQDIFISKEGHGEAIPKPTVLNVSSNEEKCRKTVVFSTTNEEENHSTVVQPIIECPNCNYPVVGDFTSCPCCGTPLKRANTSTNNEYKTIRVEEEVPSVSEEKMLCHECGRCDLHGDRLSDLADQQQGQGVLRARLRHSDVRHPRILRVSGGRVALHPRDEHSCSDDRKMDGGYIRRFYRKRPLNC